MPLEETSASPSAPLYVFGQDDYLCLGAGWHPLQEGPGGVPCRWMSPRATLRVPDELRGVRAMELLVTAPHTIQGHRPGLSVYDGDTLLAHCADLGPECQWSEQRFEFPAPISGEHFLTLCVEYRDGGTTTPLQFLPNLVLRNGDIRELGIQAARLRYITG